MIRFMVITTLVGLLVLVLALPATRTPQQFLGLLRAEHAAVAAVWGADAADTILQRALALEADSARVTPVPRADDAPVVIDARRPGDAASAARRAPADSPVAREMAAVNQRLFSNPYFRSVEALMLLAAFRLATVLHWLPWLAAFGVTALVDGLTVRRIRAAELRPHDPERFAVFGGLAVLGGCIALTALVAPIAMPPLVAAWGAIGIDVLVAMAVAEFHRRMTA